MITEEEFQQGMSPKGGITKKQFKKWGISYPLPKGWKKRLVYPIDMDKSLKRENNMDAPSWHYAFDPIEQERLSMKKLYQEKSGDYSY